MKQNWLIWCLISVLINLVYCEKSKYELNQFLKNECTKLDRICIGLSLSDQHSLSSNLTSETNQGQTNNRSIDSITNRNHLQTSIGCVHEGDCDLAVLIDPDTEFVNFRMIGLVKNEPAEIRMLLRYNPFQIDGHLQFRCISSVSAQPDSSSNATSHKSLIKSSILQEQFLIANEAMSLEINPTLQPVASNEKPNVKDLIDCHFAMSTRSMLYGFTENENTRLYLPLNTRPYSFRLAASPPSHSRSAEGSDSKVLYGPSYLINMRTPVRLPYNLVFYALLLFNGGVVFGLTTFVIGATMYWCARINCVNRSLR